MKLWNNPAKYEVLIKQYLRSILGISVDEVESFTYLGSIVDNTGGTEAKERARIG